jgi:predicted DNA-binding WGR domain protein
MDWIRIRWHKGTRYYEAHLHQDLWDQWVLTRVWGRRGTQLGQIKHSICNSYEEGLAELDEVRVRREKRGYGIVE